MLNSLKSNTLLTGSTVYLVSNILNALIPFALLPILTRHLKPEEYGEVAMFQTLLGVLLAFIGLSMAGAAGRKFYDSNLNRTQLAEFNGACLQILLFSCLVSLLVLGTFRTYFSEWLGLDTQWILLAAAITAANVVVQIRLGQWQVRKQAVNYGALQISRSAMDFLLSLIFIIVLIRGADGRISAQSWAVTIFSVVSIWNLKKDGLLTFFCWRPDFIREALKFGIPLIPHVGGGFLLMSADRFFINSELGLSQTGVYMVAVQFSAALALIFDAINKAYVPWLFERLKRDQECEKLQIVRYTYGWYALILCGAVVAFIIGPWLVNFIAGEKYADAGNVIGWLALGQIFGGMYLMVTNYIFYSKRTGMLSLVTMVSGLINISLLFFLIGNFGMEGAAYAFCISMAIRFLLTWLVAQRRHPMPWLDIKKRIN